MRASLTKTAPWLRSAAILALLALGPASQGRDAATNAPVVDARPESNAEEVQALRRRVEELERLVKQLQEHLETKPTVLETNRDPDKEDMDFKVKELPKLVVGAEGFLLSSAKGDFRLQLGGELQVDSRTFFHDSGIAGNDGLLIRRLRPIIQGRVFKDFDFVFVPDFGGTSGPQLFDAFINYRYSAALQLMTGKFKAPVGLELLQPDQWTLLNERSLATELVPNRDVGIQLHGLLAGGIVSYAAGLFNGVGDSRNSGNADFEDDKAFAGRIIFQPLKTSTISALQGFGFGLAGSYESMQRTNTSGLPSTTGGTLAGYASDGQQQFFAYNPIGGAVVVANGEHWRLSPQGFYFHGPLAFLAEYVISDQRVTRTAKPPFQTARLENTGWEITGSWVITGEDYAYNGGVTPRNNFKPLDGGWGALQLVARYAELDIDPAAFPLFSDPNTSASAAAAWSVGLNWYLNRNVSLKGSFSHTHFTGGGGGTSLTPPGAVTRKDENVLFTRVQLYF